MDRLDPLQTNNLYQQAKIIKSSVHSAGQGQRRLTCQALRTLRVTLRGKEVGKVVCVLVDLFVRGRPGLRLFHLSLQTSTRYRLFSQKHVRSISPLLPLVFGLR
jgi:hypothetical protein